MKLRNAIAGGVILTALGAAATVSYVRDTWHDNFNKYAALDEGKKNAETIRTLNNGYTCEANDGSLFYVTRYPDGEMQINILDDKKNSKHVLINFNEKTLYENDSANSLLHYPSESLDGLCECIKNPKKPIKDDVLHDITRDIIGYMK